ncbi:MAG: hypothetical protein CSA62_03865 [Planctomycetota bacterium]|nr:MAG: hypothetical protein CSA62_03865 [Planctomycetota bacterium]
MAFSYDAPLPCPGLPIRLTLAGVQWLVEADAQWARCVAIGREILFQGLLALPEKGRLILSCHPPTLPLELRFEQPLILVPGTGIQGWVALPLRQRLCCDSGAGSNLELVKLEDPGLSTAWREGLGYFHPFDLKLEREPRRLDEDLGLRFWVRLRFSNEGVEVQRVERLKLELGGYELASVRGGLPIGPAARVRVSELAWDLEWRVLPLIGRRKSLEPDMNAEERS